MKRKRLRWVVIYVGAALLLIWAVAPVYWIVVSSISTRIELYATPIKHWFPHHPTLQNFVQLFTSGTKYRGGTSLPSRSLLLSGFRNSTLLALISATILTFISSLAGYAFARLTFPGKQLIFMLIILFVPLPIWVVLISLYFLLGNLGLVDTIPGLVLVFVAYGTPLYLWLMRTFIEATPVEIEEAARIDGATRWGSLWRVVLPVALPGVTSVFLVAFLTVWNNFLIPLIFSSSQASQPLTVVTSLFIGQYEVAWNAMAAAAVLTILPPALMALFFQRFLVRGLAFGAVK